MKRSELVQMLDGTEFRRLLSLAKISLEDKQQIIRDRSEWLWQTYKPSDEDLEYVKAKIKRKETW